MNRVQRDAALEQGMKELNAAVAELQAKFAALETQSTKPTSKSRSSKPSTPTPSDAE